MLKARLVPCVHWALAVSVAACSVGCWPCRCCMQLRCALHGIWVLAYYGDLLAYELLNVLEKWELFLFAEGNGFTGKTCATCTANAVHIAFGDIGELVID